MKIVAICNRQADRPLYMWPDVWSGDFSSIKKGMVIYDAECPYWDQVSSKRRKTHKKLDILKLFLSNDNWVTSHSELDYCDYLSRDNVTISELWMSSVRQGIIKQGIIKLKHIIRLDNEG